MKRNLWDSEFGKYPLNRMATRSCLKRVCSTMSNTILLVDDRGFFLQIYGQELKKAGFEVHLAHSGKEALLELSRLEGQIDCVILDAMMPDMDGFQTCEMIRSDEKFRKIPILFLTAKAKREYVIKAVKAGGDDFYVKGPDIDGLVAKVRKLIEKGRTEGEGTVQ